MSKKAGTIRSGPEDKTDSERMATHNQQILIIASFAESIIKFRGDLIGELVSKGYSVHISAPNVPETIAQQVRSIGATVLSSPLSRSGLNPLSDLKYYRYLATLLKDLRPAFVLTYTVKPNIWGSIAASRAGIPSAAMITGLGYAFIDNGTLKQKLVRRVLIQLYRIALNNCTVLLFQNNDDLQALYQQGCFADKNKAFVTNGSGVNTHYYANADLPDAPVFLLIARLLISKGIREFVEASKLVKAEHPSARFQLVGYLDPGPDGIRQPELDQWISEGIEYLGAVEDVRPAIADASVYVLPSYREGTPRSVLEAMSMGRPVITTDAPGCRETVIDGKNGFLVPGKDVAALANTMKQLAASKQLRETFGEASRALAVEKFDVALVNQQILQHTGLDRQSGAQAAMHSRT